MLNKLNVLKTSVLSLYCDTTKKKMSLKLQNEQETIRDLVSTLWKNSKDYASFLETVSRQ